MKIEIRKTKISDDEQDIKLADSVWRTTYAHIMPKEIFDDRESKFAKRIEAFGSWGLNENGNINYAAVHGDKIVGILHGSTLSNYLHYRELGYSDLTAIYIYPEYQHQGLGKRLLDTIINEFKKQGSKKMVIGVLKENHKARKAYEKWGGVLDTTYEATYNKFGYSFPEVFYIFDLTNMPKTDNRLYLKVPTINELDYRIKLLADPETMEYNKGYGDDDTGCYYLTKEKAERWYNYWTSDPKRYYAYIMKKDGDIPIGDVNIHFDKDYNLNMIGIVIEAKHRGKGYSEEALRLLADVAFYQLGLDAIFDCLPHDRPIAEKVFVKVGFVWTDNDILLLTKDRYEIFKNQYKN